MGTADEPRPVEGIVGPPSEFSATGHWHGLLPEHRRVMPKFCGAGLVCPDCYENTEVVYWVTGHDHTDEFMHVCTCRPN